MMDNYNYPMGADTASAPWNSGPDDIEVEVYVEVTISKTIKVRTLNYDQDPDGSRYIGDLHDDVYDAVRNELPKDWEFERLNYEL